MRQNFSFRSLVLATSALCTLAIASARADSPKTPIQHVIIIVGENHTFDNLFGTYKPKSGQTIDNLLSKGIVNADGTPGPHFDLAKQRIGRDENRYTTETFSTGAYATLPQPYTTSGIGLPPGVPDTRFPANLPNGPYQISKYVPYAAYTGDPVHRFFQMWQDVDGGKHDKFVWVEETIGTGSNGAPPPSGGFNPKEGAISMGFYNMNPFTDAAGHAQPGDAPFFKSLADTYAIGDNYHQAIMGGTGANFQALVTGDAAFFTNTNLNGHAAVPFANQIENPDPVQGIEDRLHLVSVLILAGEVDDGVHPQIADLPAEDVGKKGRVASGVVGDREGMNEIPLYRFRGDAHCLFERLAPGSPAGDEFEGVDEFLILQGSSESIGFHGSSSSPKMYLS